MRTLRTCLGLLFGVVAFGLLASNASAQTDVPSAEALLADIAKASGTKPTNEHYTIAFHGATIDGTSDVYESANGKRIATLAGPFSEETGQSAGRRWTCDFNTQCVLADTAADEAAPETYVTTVTHVGDPFDAYVLSRLTAKGDGTREYIDPATSHIVRVEVIKGAAKTTTTFDTFVTADHFTRARHWKIDDGTPQGMADFTITTMQTGSVTDKDIAVPKERALVTFPDGTDSVELPVRLYEGKFIVRVTIGGRGLDMILDTGASGIILDEDVARSLGLNVQAAHRNAANAGAFTESRAIVPAMSVGALTMANVAISTSPHLTVEKPGQFSSVGLVGFDFFSGATVALDYDGQKVTAFRPATFVAPTDPLESVIPIRLGTFEPRTEAAINGAIGNRFIVDTGGPPIGILVFDYFARNNPAVITGESPRRGMPVMSGVGGLLDLDAFLAKSIVIGKVAFRDYPGYRTKGTVYGPEDGLVGPTFLRFFTVYVDYPRRRMILVPNATGRTAMHIKG